MDTQKILQYCDQIDTLTQMIRDEVLAGGPIHPPEPTDETLVPAGGDLQAAMDEGGNIRLADGANFTKAAGYQFYMPQTAVRGNGNTVSSDQSGAAAFRLPVGARSCTMEVMTLRAPKNEVAVQIGKNDSDQTTVEQAPTDVTLTEIVVTGHRGKRAIECNGAGVVFQHCDIRDVYDPEKSDSQAIWIGNSPGDVTISGGHFEAASENIMVGGDKMKIPNCRPTNILIEDAEFTKPLAWKGNSAIPVKNLIELKDGHTVTIRRCILTNSWASGQDGYGFMFTPKNGGSLRNVLVENCTMSEVGAIVNITGHDFTSDIASSLPRTQVEFRGGSYRTNKAALGGPGRFCLITEGPERVVFTGLVIEHEGSSFLEVADKDAVDVLHILDCEWNYGSYGVRIGGYNHGDNQLGVVKDLRIEGNTITGAHSQFRERYPDNTYVGTMSVEREREVDRKDVIRAMENEVAEELKRRYKWMKD
jgi:hypothetical protein